jgi:hypothetical protein
MSLLYGVLSSKVTIPFSDYLWHVWSRYIGSVKCDPKEKGRLESYQCIVMETYGPA